MLIINDNTALAKPVQRQNDRTIERQNKSNDRTREQYIE